MVPFPDNLVYTLLSRGLGIPFTVLLHSPHTGSVSLWEPSVTTPGVNSGVGWRTVVFHTSKNHFYML